MNICKIYVSIMAQVSKRGDMKGESRISMVFITDITFQSAEKEGTVNTSSPFCISCKTGLKEGYTRYLKKGHALNLHQSGACPVTLTSEQSL